MWSATVLLLAAGAAANIAQFPQQQFQMLQTTEFPAFESFPQQQFPQQKQFPQQQFPQQQQLLQQQQLPKQQPFIQQQQFPQPQPAIILQKPQPQPQPQPAIIFQKPQPQPILLQQEPAIIPQEPVIISQQEVTPLPGPLPKPTTILPILPVLPPKQPLLPVPAATLPPLKSNTCRNTALDVVVFMTWAVQHSHDNFKLAQQNWDNSACANCAEGNQKMFPVAGNQQIENVQPGDAIVDQVFCKQAAELCVETLDGRFFQGFAPVGNETLLLSIFSHCEAGTCEPRAVVDASDADESMWSQMGVREVNGNIQLTVDDHLQPRMQGAAKIFLSESEFNYLRVKGVSCNACEQKLAYCKGSN